MAKTKKVNGRTYSLKTKPSITSGKSTLIGSQSITQKLESQLNLNQSYASLVIGLVILLIVGFLVFNHLKSQSSNIGVAEQTSQKTQTVNNSTSSSSKNSANTSSDKYTVKDGDTLFQIAQKYYQDGYKYPLIASANKINNPDLISTGQSLTIPKLTTNNTPLGTGGSTDQTIWGEKISGNTYTVEKGDWLSKIAGRAYGDIYAYTKIAKANNITDPNTLEVGTVLKIPR